MEKIKSITEAFSNQPITLMVCEKESPFRPEDSIKEIVLERTDGTTFYVGYNFKGKRIFKYLAKSVNVHYL